VRKAAALVAGAVGLAAAGYVAERSIMRRERRRPDAAANDVFTLPDTIVERTLAMDDGGSIHVVECGAGRPLVLLHGVTLTHEVWIYQLRELSDRFRVVAVDQRGHGRSTEGREGLRIGRMAADMAAMLRELDLRDAIIVGHSMGGMVLLQLALDFPELVRERVSGIVLLSTTARSAPKIAAAGLVAKAALPAGRRGIPLAARLPGGLLPANDLSYLVLRLGFGRRPSQTHVELTRTIEATMSPQAPATLLGELFQFDAVGRLGAIDVPALVIVGTADHLTPVSAARAIAANLPGAEMAVLPDGGHMLMLERRAELEELLTDFAARTASVEMVGR
jgi:pimeloyl-ACP methyl ester carboxylesterase